MAVRRILVTNGKLGRQGKTTLAYTLYKTAQAPFKYVTNDLDNASINLQQYVADNLAYMADDDEIDVDLDDNLVFDFGGLPDGRLLTVAKFVDTIIVPIAFQSASELTITIKNINTFLSVNSNIVIVINNTELADAKMVKMALGATFPDLKILEISSSKFIRRLANNNKTVFEVAELNRGDRTNLNKKIIPQYKELFDAIDLEIKE